MTRDANERAMDPHDLTPELFARLGAGQVGYLRQMSSDDLARLFPGAAHIARGLRLWALLNADGTPIIVADSREAALANAYEHDLTMVPVH